MFDSYYFESNFFILKGFYCCFDNISVDNKSLPTLVFKTYR